jgi:two-component system OmpR family response regulator
MTGPTILLVEDNRLLRWWMTCSLQYEGWVVSAPQSPNEAIALAGAKSFDVVITDWRLPEGHFGCEILARVREKSPRTLAILISAESGGEFTDQARACGFDLVIEKPFPVAEIVGAVHHLTGRLPAKAVC